MAKNDRDRARWQAARDEMDAADRNNDDEGWEKANQRAWSVPGSQQYQQEWLDKKYPRGKHKDR